MDGLAGVTAIETNAAAVTVMEVVPLTVPEVAVMVLVPTPAAVASPPEAMVATLFVDEDHVAVLVRFWVVLSL